MNARNAAPEIEITSPADLRDWLLAHHRQTTGIWVVTHKKSQGDLYVSIGAIILECLCFGWVDSQNRGKDSVRTMHYICPRKPGSSWSKVNKENVVRLLSEGRMQPSGLSVIEQAKSNGSWTKLDAVEALILPDDLRDALTKETRSRWEACPRSHKRAALLRLVDAKRDATRQRLIERICTDLLQGRRPFD